MNERISISVKDNGIGIPVDKQKNIFNRFEKVDKSLRRENEGSGIGRSLVKLLVNKLDGNIYLKSQPSKGSEFVVEIPCMTTPETSEFNIENTSVNNIVERAKIEFSDILLTDKDFYLSGRSYYHSCDANPAHFLCLLIYSIPCNTFFC